MKPQTRSIRNKADAMRFTTWLGNVTEFPLMVTIKPGEEKRSDKQNRLQHMWFREAEEQGDMTAPEWRAHCKLHIGCKILYEENEEFRQAYNSVLRGLTYEQKIACMLPPLDFTVTRIMIPKQKSKYLDEVYQFLRGKGFELTLPCAVGL
jgi:hypothetical protein